MNDADWLIERSDNDPMPKLRSHVTWIQHRGEQRSWWILSDPISNQHYRCDAFEAEFLQRLDGKRTLRQIMQELSNRFSNVECTPQRAIAALRFAESRSLLIRLDVDKTPNIKPSPFTATAPTGYMKGLRQKLLSLVYQRIPLGNPNPFAHWLARRTDWLFQRESVQFWVGFILAGWTMLLLTVNKIEGSTLAMAWNFQAIQDWRLWLGCLTIFVLTRCFHEAAHACVCARSGANCNGFGLMRILCIAFPYVDVTDAWRIASKRDRIFVFAAGMYVEAVVSAFAIWVWILSDSLLIQQWSIVTVVLCTLASFLFNANPLMKYDGYYMLSDWLDLADLQRDSKRVWRQTLNKFLLKLQSKAVPLGYHHEPKARWFLMAYLPASFVYRCSLTFAMLVAVLLTLHAWKLTDVGWSMASLMIVLGMATTVDAKLRSLHEPVTRGTATNDEKRSIVKTRVFERCLVWTFSVALLAALSMIPLPERIFAQGKVVTDGRKPIYVSSPASVLSSFETSPTTRLSLDRLAADHEIANVRQSIEELQAKEGAINKSAYFEPKLLAQLPHLSTVRQLREKRLDSLEQQSRMYSFEFGDNDTFLPIDLREAQTSAKGMDFGMETDLMQVRSLSVADEAAIGIRLEQGKLLGYRCGAVRNAAVLAVISQDQRAAIYIGQRANLRLHQDPSRVLTASVRNISQLIHPTEETAIELFGTNPDVVRTKPHYQVELALEIDYASSFVEDGNVDVVFAARGDSLLTRTRNYLSKLTR